MKDSSVTPFLVTLSFVDEAEILAVSHQHHVGHPKEQTGADNAWDGPEIALELTGRRQRIDRAINDAVAVVAQKQFPVLAKGRRLAAQLTQASLAQGQSKRHYLDRQPAPASKLRHQLFFAHQDH